MSLVLIVDDQPGIRELLVNWISREGYQTAQAGDDAAALDEMMRRPADVVFCDVQMPGQSEFQLAARLHDRFPETAIILATGDSDVPPLITLQPGVAVYLAMPFGREAVLKAVRIGMQWHRMSMAVRAKKDDRTDSIETWLATDNQGRSVQNGPDGAVPKGSKRTSPRASELEQQLRRVREEYLDVPNLRLTPSGAQRLFALQPLRCMEILEALMGENFLKRTSDGLFARSGSDQPAATRETRSVKDVHLLRAG